MSTPQADFQALAATWGTPYYLYDLDAAIAQARALREALPPSVWLYYAVKANPNRRVVEALGAVVDGLDISSAGELRLGLAAGVAPERLSFAGPGKTDDELTAAITAGVGILSLESPRELVRAARIAEALHRRVAVTLRLNPLETAREFPMRMGGGPSPFGIAEEEVDEVIAAARRSPALELRGLHVFAGTNCLDAPALVANVGQTLEIARRLAERHALAWRLLNLGGGFGIPYFAGQSPLDGPAVMRAVGETVERARRESPHFEATRFILELGRFLIGPFGTYVARVVDVKETRGKRFAILDGGMNHCFPATGSFGQVIKKNYPLRNLSRDGAPRVQEIVGPLCTPIDSLARSIELPQAEVGDLIAFLQCGAYALTASPLEFLSHDTPAELTHRDGAITLARARATTT